MRSQLAQTAEQRLAMSPGMLQSIEVLALSAIELVERIDAELAGNETLELLRPAGVDEAPDRRSPRDASDQRYALLQELPAPGPDLIEHLRIQLAMREVAEPLREAVLDLAVLCDERGYLELEEPALIAAVGPGLYEPAMELLGQLDPVGLGARGPVEAMLAQVGAQDPDRPLIDRVLREQLEDLALERHATVARALDLEQDELQLLLARIATLDPRPAARFHERPPTQTRPEVEVREGERGLEVVVDDLALPLLGIDEQYESMVQRPELDQEARRYLRGKLGSARDLIEAVEMRKQTLARVAVAIFTEQRAFLRRGAEALRPLKMSDIAARLELHLSTVSRAVAHKHVITPQGTFPLRVFFDGARAGGGEVGRGALMARLRALVEAEDKARPWSDDQLAAALSAGHAVVARRTVAKYRSELGIPARSVRRRRE